MQERGGPWYVLSFGAGVNSMALGIHLIKTGAPLDEVVFADTGAEVPETYEYVETARRYFADHGIPFRTVRKHGATLYETCQRRRVIPSALWRWSTRDFKVRPIHRHYRSLQRPIIQYLAIAYDEVQRMKDSSVAFIENSFPLVDEQITRVECERIISAEGLAVPVKSGCWFCPFNNVERWRWLERVHPDLYGKAIELEEGSKHYPRQRLTDQAFRKRASVPLRELKTHLSVIGDPVEAPCGGECLT